MIFYFDKYGTGSIIFFNGCGTRSTTKLYYLFFIGGTEIKKKSLKRIGSTVLVTAMALGLLAGCGGKTGDSANSTTKDANGATVIKFGIHTANPKEQESVTYNIVEAFNKEYEGKYKVEFVAADTESNSKNMKLAAQDGTLPEIIHLDSAEAPEYNEAGYLLDLSDFLKENTDIEKHLMVWKMPLLQMMFSMVFLISVMYKVSFIEMSKTH